MRPRLRGGIRFAGRTALRRGKIECSAWTTYSPAKASPRATPTRSATGFPTRSSIWSTGKPRRPAIDPWTVRVACETLATTNRVVIAGEVRVPPSLMKTRQERQARSSTPRKFKSAARRAIRDIGYEQDGFHWKTARSTSCCIRSRPTSPRASTRPSDKQGEEGAGDQGIMFGYACKRDAGTDAGADLLRHKILELLATARKAGEGEAAKLGPDAKSQVTVRYEDGKPAEVTSDRPVDPASRRQLGFQEGSRGRRALYPRGPGRPADRRATATGTSTRPANSSSAAPTATPASPAARSSSTPMAARRRMAAAPSRARTRPRSTARPPMRRATSPRTSSRPSSPTAARSSFPMPSAWRSRCRSMSTCTAPARSTRTVEKALRKVMDLSPSRHPPASRPQQADLRQDRRPMAISAASRAATAPSPGRRPIWRRR